MLKSKQLVLGAVAAAAIGLGVGSSASAALITQYTFDEASGSYANSGTATTVGTINGNGLHGADGSGVSGQPGDRAYNNIPSGSRVDFGNTPGATGGNTAMTITFWYKAADASAVITAGSRVLNSDGAIIYGGDTNTGGFRIQLNPTPPDTNVIYSSNAQTEGSGYLQDDTWVFAAIAWDGSTVNFYSGTDSSSLVSQGSVATFAGKTTNEFVNTSSIGNRGGAQFNRQLDVLFDDFRIYDEGLNAAQLEAVRLEAIPEPGSMALMGLGGLLVLARRRKA